MLHSLPSCTSSIQRRIARLADAARPATIPSVPEQPTTPTESAAAGSDRRSGSSNGGGVVSAGGSQASTDPRGSTGGLSFSIPRRCTPGGSTGPDAGPHDESGGEAVAPSLAGAGTAALAPAVGQTATAQQGLPEGCATVGLAAPAGPVAEAAARLCPPADAVTAAHQIGSRGEGGAASSETAGAGAPASAAAEQLSELSGTAGSLAEEPAAASPVSATTTATSLPATAATAKPVTAELPLPPCPGQMIPNSPPPSDLPSLFERLWWLSAPAKT